MTTTTDTPTSHADTGREAERRDEGRTIRRDRLMQFIERYALVVLFALTFLFFSLWPKTSATFPTSANIKNVLGNQAVIGILALAIIIPLVCGEFDFSVGSLAGLSQVIVAGMMSRLGLPLMAAIAIGLGLGLLVGIVNGNTIARVGVNSLIVTLGLATALFGVVEWYTHGQSIITNISPTLTSFGSGDWLGIPRTVYFLAFIAVIVYYVLELTPFGRYLHGIGSNRDAARLVGLPVARYVFLAFICSGLLASIAGMLIVARNGSASPQVGTVTDTLQALSAAFLGATAIKPGQFNVVGTLVAIFFLAFSVTGLSLAGVANWINEVFNGAALFLAVLISTLVGRRRTAPV